MVAFLYYLKELVIATEGETTASFFSNLLIITHKIGREESTINGEGEHRQEKGILSNGKDGRGRIGLHGGEGRKGLWNLKLEYSNGARGTSSYILRRARGVEESFTVEANVTPGKLILVPGCLCAGDSGRGNLTLGGRGA